MLSPLAPSAYPDMPAIDGVVLATAEAGIKYKARADLLIASFPDGAEAAGVLTRSATASAAVEWCRARLAAGTASALVVNSGNANAFTGVKGRAATEATARYAGAALGCDADSVFLASTGVIGEPLETDTFEAVLNDTAQRMGPKGFDEAARAIMTTDTFPKYATVTADLGGTPVTLNGIAKGSGMIAPDMATMLAFVFTDAPIAAPVLQSMLKTAADATFNAITVDSDTSTSDTLLVFATGKAPAPRIKDTTDRRLRPFKAALGQLLKDLAHQVVRDGEGATKFVSVTVEGARSKKSARTVAMAIANSPLVKTAIAGEDANWGRVVMAVGKAGEPADRDRIAIWFGDVQVALDGERHPDYDEDAVSRLMKQEAIAIRVDLGIGKGRFQAWTCDFTHGYISINADYRS